MENKFKENRIERKDDPRKIESGHVFLFLVIFFDLERFSKPFNG